MGKYCDRGKNRHLDYDWFPGFQPHLMWKTGFWNADYVSISVYMDVRLASTWKIGRILFKFDIW
jgi:hypothetical protein